MTGNQADDHRPIITAGTYDPEDRGETPHRTGGAEVVGSTDLARVRRTPWAAAGQLRATSALAPNEYRAIFPTDAEHRFKRAHRDFLPEHIELLADMVRLYRGEDAETTGGSGTLLKERFPDGEYVDVPGLCRVATLAEIGAQGWSLNPGRYTSTALVEDDGEDFAANLGGLYDEFTRLSDEADGLRAKVAAAVQGILGA